MAGFFKIQREYLETSEWANGEPFDEAKAWIDIVGRANYAEAEIFYRGKYQRVHRGQLATSEVYLANRWNWSRGRVRRFLRNLIDASRITTDKTRVGTIITVVNYDIYQDKRPRNKTTNDTANGRQTDITRYNLGTQKKKNKEEKEEGGTRARARGTPTLDEVSLFVSEEGLDVDPDRFWNYYEGVGWKVSGRPIENWQAICRRWDGTEDYGKPKDKRMTEEEEQAELHRLLDILEQGGNIYDTSGS